MKGYHAYDFTCEDTKRSVYVYCDEQSLAELIAMYEGMYQEFAVFELLDSSSYQVIPEDDNQSEHEVISFSYCYERVYCQKHWMTQDEYREYVLKAEGKLK